MNFYSQVPCSEQEQQAQKDAGVKRPKKNREIMLHGIWGKGVPGPLQPEATTATGAAAVGILRLK